MQIIKKFKKNFFNSIIVMFSILLLTTCGNDKQAKEMITFRYNQSSGISSLDPAFAKDQANIWAVNQLFNGLLQLDDDLKIQPCIAKRWKVSEDGKTYTFHLRNDIYFHDHKLFKDSKGRKVIANDIVYSFNRIIDPDVASPGAWIFNNRIDKENPFKAIDDTTFQIKLLKPFPPFLGILTMQYCSVVPKEIVEHYGKDFRKYPIGTGPFKFKVWEEGSTLIMNKNEQYFETDGNARLPYLDAVRVSFLDEPQIEFMKFIRGELDFLWGVEGNYKDDILTKEGTLQPQYQDKINLYKLPYLNTEYLGFLVNKVQASPNNPLLKKEVRQAINYGFDREKMIKFLKNNSGIPATKGFIPPVLLGKQGDEIEGYKYNPQKAQLLLKAAGYDNGEGLPEITLFTNSMYVDLCTFIQNQLQDVGIKIKLEVVEPATLREMMAQSKINFFRGSWIADYPDPETFLTVFYGQNPAPPNYTRFNNVRFDSLYNLAMNESNDEVRLTYYVEMDKIMIEEAPIVPLFYDQAVRFTHKNIENISINAMNLLSLKKVKKTNSAIQ